MLAVVNTLQEFMKQTKGIVYVLIVAYLVMFPLWWKFLNRNNRDY
jgi:hypothetical protein